MDKELCILSKKSEKITIVVTVKSDNITVPINTRVLTFSLECFLSTAVVRAAAMSRAAAEI